MSLYSHSSSFDPQDPVLITSRFTRLLRRLAPDSCSFATTPDLRTHLDLMMRRTRSQHSTSVDSLPLYHNETETVALKEVLNLAVLCEFPFLFPPPSGGTFVAMPQPYLEYTCSASPQIIQHSRAHNLYACGKLHFCQSAEVRCSAQPVSVEPSHLRRSRARPHYNVRVSSDESVENVCTSTIKKIARDQMLCGS